MVPIKQFSRKILSALLVVSASMTAFSCGGNGELRQPDDALLSIDDSTLYVSDVVERIPVGIDPADSLALFKTIVDNWIEDMLLSDLAKNKLPDIAEIERQVDDYRNRLIVESYLARMREGRQFKVESDSVRSFYDAHRSEMTAEVPLVKGIFVKVPESAYDLEEIRRCVFDGSDASIDELEKNWMGDALQYDCFVNNWIDWSLVAEQIPYRFTDPDDFLKSNRNFETRGNGNAYLLHISEWLPSGSELPFEFAAIRISAILEQSKMESYEKALVKSLLKKAIDEDRLKSVGYDPLTRRRILHRHDKEKMNREDEK